MRIIEKLKEKVLSPRNTEPITLAFLGDSVTQGCFEIYKNSSTTIETVFDVSSAYHTYVRDILCALYPNAPVNIINAGISGDTSEGGLDRLERDVLRFSPDLVVVAFGLNDSSGGLENLESYRNNMTKICATLMEKGIEVIVLTTNMMVTKENYNYFDKLLSEVNERCRKTQNEGVLDAYMNVAVEVAESCGCPVCDCYKKWKTLHKNGVNTDLFLSNGVNHPTREMNKMFAYSLIKTMFQ